MRSRAFAWLAVVALASFAHAAIAQSVRDVQAREARASDARLLDHFARFRNALIGRFGADPWLSMMRVAENEAEALVHRDANAQPVHAIFRDGTWIDPQPHRRLEPWSRAPTPAQQLFRLSTAGEPLWRARIAAHRSIATQATDHLGPISVGWFGKPFERIVVEMRVASLSTFELSAVVTDLDGQVLDLKGAIASARREREAAQRREDSAHEAATKRDLMTEIPRVLAEFRRTVGSARLMAVWIRRDRVTFIQADRGVVDYDRRGQFTRRRDPYGQSFLCSEGFDDREIEWGALHALVDRAVVAGRLDDEDKPHAEIAVERPRDVVSERCRDAVVEVKFTNYRSPWPHSAFDTRGKLLLTR
jgi:hypothetical protein